MEMPNTRRFLKTLFALDFIMARFRNGRLCIPTPYPPALPAYYW